MNSQDVRNDISSRLRNWRLRLLAQRLWVMLAILSVVVAAAILTGVPKPYWIALLVALTLVGFISVLWSRKWRLLNPDNFALHLNRRFPAFEESAQLLLQEPDKLSVLQKLQRQRVAHVYTDNLAKVEDWQAPLQHRNWIIIILVAMLVAVFADQLKSMSQQLLPQAFDNIAQNMDSDKQVSVSQTRIVITPPAYSGLPEATSDQLDIEALEGSEIQWSLEFSGKPASAYVIETSDGQQVALQSTSSGHWQAQMTAANTDLYHLLAINGESSSIIGDIHSLTVQLDQQPDIRIVEPTASTLELPKSGPVTFESEVLVSDDFGIAGVEILASVAKGSGEGVKFRDQKLEFDQSTATEKGRMYQRNWDLKALGMEPGDEIYFSILATDNKQPEPNIARSTTIIVRWLEDDKAGLAADGLAIDFIPEFFKSQRQIIIDTEQLIEDKPNLAEQVFKDTSYGIGQAQADLKQKYGQFLGDEFGEGPGEQLGPGNPAASADHGEEDHEGDHDESRDAADSHGHAESGVTINNASNINDIVKLFGHDHGDPEIGKISKQSPIALMKRAVSEMWSAEKHLMQAEAELALPFEYEAYKYLKLARQADRIYVKRLGFEPPPVTEERRLTGKLDEIQSYSTSQQTDPQMLSQARQTQQLLRQSWKLLSSHIPQSTIDAGQDEVLAQMSQQFKQMSQQRPALIKQAATLEKLRAAKAWQLNNCQDCLQELQQSIWNLMDDGDASLHFPGQVYSSDDELTRAYQSYLQSGLQAGSDTSESAQPTGSQSPR